MLVEPFSNLFSPFSDSLKEPAIGILWWCLAYLYFTQNRYSNRPKHSDLWSLMRFANDFSWDHPVPCRIIAFALALLVRRELPKAITFSPLRWFLLLPTRSRPIPEGSSSFALLRKTVWHIHSHRTREVQSAIAATNYCTVAKAWPIRRRQSYSNLSYPRCFG